MKHLMIDLETMGTESYAAILSIAAVQFDIETGETGEKFYRAIQLESCVNHGLKIEPRTVLWWLSKSEEARQAYLGCPHTTLGEALCCLSEFIERFFLDGPEIWGNAARFDLGLLINAYSVAGLQIPWDVKNEWCVRTLAKIRPEIKAAHTFEGVAHNPIDDCLNQISYCVATWKTINHV